MSGVTLANISIFADGNVGVQSVRFLIENHLEDISNFVVTNQESPVYLELKNSSILDDQIIFQKDLSSSKLKDIDYIFLIWWPHIIGDDIIESTKHGVINTHPSLLPFNRGKNYNFWNLVEDVPFGVTLHFVTSKIDAGDMIFQCPIEKNWEDTGQTLYEKAQLQMVKLFKSSYKRVINGDYDRLKQDLEQGSFHNSKELFPASEIFLEQKYTAKEILNLLRARTFPPHDGCYFFDDNKKYQIRVNIEEVKK